MQTNNKLREALKLAKSCLDGYGNINDLELRRKVDAALAEQPRNCEKCKNADEAVALAVNAGVVDCDFGAREMAEFLLTEAKEEISS